MVLSLYMPIFYVLILMTVKICNNEVFKIPFALYNWNEKNRIHDTVNNIFFNLIYINLTIGTPPQTIPFALNINSQTFYILKEDFNSNKSSSFKLLSNKEIIFKNEDIISGYSSKDILKIDNNEEEINFIYQAKIKNELYNLSNIGLLIPSSIQEDIFPFFSSLKNAGLINSYVFTLKYFNNISLYDTIYKKENKSNVIGEFIIGDEPHNYEKEKNIYNEEKYMKTYPLWYDDKMYWDIQFDSIYMGEGNNTLKISGSYFTEINLDLGFIVAHSIYYREINNIFFNKYKKLCREKFLPETLFRYMECDRNETLNLSSFPTIYFEHKEFETTFNFTYKDLFLFDRDKNKYIFLVFNDRQTDHWIFGSIFLRKYQLTFNIDSKTIGYYKSMFYEKEEFIENDDKEDNEDEKKEEEKENPKNPENENEEEESNKNNKNNQNNKNNDNENQLIIYILIGLLSLILFILTIYIGILVHKKMFNNKKKKRINELEETNSFDDYEKEEKFIKSTNNEEKNIKKNFEFDNNIN